MGAGIYGTFSADSASTLAFFECEQRVAAVAVLIPPCENDVAVEYPQLRCDTRGPFSDARAAWREASAESRVRYVWIPIRYVHRWT